MFFVIGLLLLFVGFCLALYLQMEYGKAKTSPPRLVLAMVTALVVGLLFTVGSVLALLWRVMP